MFVGHFGVGLAAKRAAPRVSLGTLFLAAQFLDLLWPTFLLLGVEHVAIEPGITAASPLDFTDYPISHSLLAAVFWAFFFGAVYYGLRRRAGLALARRGAIVAGLAVLSHWILDLLVHRPDLPLAPDAPSRYYVGLDLWSSIPATLALELSILAIGLVVYLRATQAKDRIGAWGLAALVAFLLAVYLGGLFAPPPTSATAIAVAGEAQWLLVLWAWWIDRHRRVRP